MLFTAGIAMAEALLFSLMASLVDWLTGVKPADLWLAPSPVLWALLAVLGAAVRDGGVRAAIHAAGLARSGRSPPHLLRHLIGVPNDF